MGSTEQAHGQQTEKAEDVCHACLLRVHACAERERESGRGADMEGRALSAIHHSRLHSDKQGFAARR